MKKFPRGTILKLKCDVHEFLSKAPKAYEDLIDIIDEDGKVKVKTHNGDYVGLYGMKRKIHTSFMKKFEVVGETIGGEEIIDTVDSEVVAIINSDLSIDDKAPLSIMSHVDVAKWRDCDDSLIGEVNKWCKEKKPELAQERIELKLALLEEVTDSLAKAASKLNSLGYEFSYGEWLSQEEISKRKLDGMVSKVNDMATYQIAQLLIDNNIEL